MPLNSKQKAIEAELSVNCRIVCYFCGEEDTYPQHESTRLHGYAERGISVPQQAAIHFHADGWRNVTSRKYQVTGAIRCPDCKGKV